MSDPSPRTDATGDEAALASTTLEAGGAAEPTGPTGPSFDAATVTPPEPQTMPDIAGPTSFTVPQEAQQRGPSDKLWVNFAWEGMLLVLVALGIAAFFLFGPSGGLGGAGEVAELLAGATPFLLFATALGLSMRVGSVNLAVVHLGLLSTTLFTAMLNEPLIVAIGVVALVMVVAGVVLSLLVTVFKAPGWAASLAVAMLAWFLVSERELGIFTGGQFPDADSRPQVGPLGDWAIVAAVVGLSIIGGAIALARPIRDTMGVCVEVTERRRGLSVGSFFLTWAALIGSCLLAGAAGYLVMLPTGANLSIAVVNANGLAPLLTGLGIVLIGGTAARGRRGGVFGTLLAAVIVFMVAMLFQDTADSWIINNAIPFGALLLGLLVNGLMDLINRPNTTIHSTHPSLGPNPAAVAPTPPLAAQPFTPADPQPSTPAAQPVTPTDPQPSIPASQSAVLTDQQSTLAAQPMTPTEPPAVPTDPSAPETTAPPPEAAPQPSSTDPPPADTGETTQEIPAGANPYLYRPPAG